MMKKIKIRVLIADDEPRYVWGAKVNLENRGYEVLTAPDGQTALELVINESPDLVILDIKMPRMSGWEVCERIREFSTVPIIMLTALAEDADKVKGLELGADDYMTKPFSAAELLARIQAVLRRIELSERQDSPPSIEVGDLRIDFARQQVFVRNQKVELTSIEYRLLCEMVKNPDRVLVPDHLLEKIWGIGYEGENNLLRQAIYRLRRKIERDPQNPQYIQTKRGVGYTFVFTE